MSRAEVKWVDGGMNFDCPDCGCETHYIRLAPNVRCNHCGAVFTLPLVLDVSRVVDKRRKEIAEGM